jgi:RNA polymerase sigma factor (sigma-70 family)
MVAMVLGTALGAFGAAAPALADAPENTIRVVNDLTRYCTVCWRNARLHPDSWSDCTQEVLARMLERVDRGAWGQALRGEGEERREFLRAIDAVKKRMQRSQRRWNGLSGDVGDNRDGSDRGLQEEREQVRLAAAELLTPRQQRILQMSFEGWTVQDIATELKLPTERVSDEKYKAIRKLRVCLAEAVA